MHCGICYVLVKLVIVYTVILILWYSFFVTHRINRFSDNTSDILLPQSMAIDSVLCY